MFPSLTESLSVGLKVPEDRPGLPLVGNELPAASLNVIVALLASPEPPLSDIIMNFAPDGLTRRTSISPVAVCDRLLRVTVTLVITPLMPETVMFEGYGLAAPGPVGIEMLLEFVKVVGPSKKTGAGAVFARSSGRAGALIQLTSGLIQRAAEPVECALTATVEAAAAPARRIRETARNFFARNFF
jgi:hypothetical protein